ncbi:GNAT family N-acetyltransferase [Dactylosporangium sp. AC04546]|uniref:GNAT family N-acetyltransferase n=1 Tax=Dactylosporangium sp. AC04546 TaxID=2862460 RepID=UPI001EDE76EC|nr:GNAT family N-acetyltransferase [Dactylosporangium sp. AC04546]WVK79184.1 GNAT family N-acetyltransferase [Dactylosporangium sp. AC04546]
MRIRTAIAADLPALRHVYREASLSNPADAPLLLARPEFLYFGGEHVAAGRTWVAEEDRIAGFATLTDGPELEDLVAGGPELGNHVNGGPELEDLFVDPARHRRGIASALVRHVAGVARAAGHRRLWVTGNEQALAFYRAAGFVLVGEVPTELGTGLRMVLDLVKS